MVAVTLVLTENLGVTEQVEVYENVLDLSDTRVSNTVSVLVKASQVLNLKLGHTLTFDNVPVEGFGKLDATATATLVAAVL